MCIRDRHYIAQIGTGNYNEKTSEQYTDLSFITTDLGIGSELATVFNNLAIERLTEHAGNLLVAPLCFKSVLMQEMDAEIEAKRMGKDARIILTVSYTHLDVYKRQDQRYDGRARRRRLR